MTGARCAVPTSPGAAPAARDRASFTLTGLMQAGGFDFATGERAGPIDMIYHATGMSDGRLFDEAARLAHMDRETAARPRPSAPARPITVWKSAAFSMAANRWLAAWPRPICAHVG